MPDIGVVHASEWTKEVDRKKISDWPTNFLGSQEDCLYLQVTMCEMFVYFLCVLFVYMFLCVQCLPSRCSCSAKDRPITLQRSTMH